MVGLIHKSGVDCCGHVHEPAGRLRRDPEPADFTGSILRITIHKVLNNHLSRCVENEIVHISTASTTTDYSYFILSIHYWNALKSVESR